MKEMPSNMPNRSDDVSVEHINQRLISGLEKIIKIKEEVDREQGGYIKFQKEEEYIKLQEELVSIIEQIPLNDIGREILNNLPIDEIKKMDPKMGGELAYKKYVITEHIKVLAEKARQRELLERAYLLGGGVNAKDEAAVQELQQIIGELSTESIREIENNVYFKSKKTDKEVLAQLPPVINILNITTRNKEGAVFHLPAAVRSINLELNEGGDYTFKYAMGVGDSAFRNSIIGPEKEYRVVGIRGGYDRTALVIIAVAQDNKEFQEGMEALEATETEMGTIELYTDIPLLQQLATPVEHSILSQKSDAYNIPKGIKPIEGEGHAIKNN